ncbi:hypothetical protein [Aurantimonas coralicida]|uniref:hypothetical protein n=1 Tax=Aurantimonas coralicida TaxID=182270 RepID=UPI001E2AAE83|nr:hypothetical protein [Aurantimonas coralicida]MCD1642585.1 hypothetical protein [Aurantimonas coralicida]
MMFGLYTFQIVAGAALAAFIAGGAAYVLHQASEAGRHAERITIHEQNRSSGDAGEDARLDRAACVAIGLRWDFVASDCLGQP